MHQATEHAQRLGQQEVDTLHLLLGLCDETNSRAAQAFGVCGVSPGQIQEVASKMAPANEPLSQVPNKLTAAGKDAVFRADAESRAEGCSSIDTCHFLLALSIEKGDLSTQCLSELGLSADKIRDAIATVRSNADD